MCALICLILVHKVYSIATDSFDVTLVYEDSKYNQAHKVILATPSVSAHTHPLINLWGFFAQSHTVPSVHLLHHGATSIFDVLSEEKISLSSLFFISIRRAEFTALF